MAVVREKKAFFGIEPICRALGLARATYYRLQSARAAQRTARYHPRALSREERHTVLGTLNEERFCDQAPAEVYASLLDEGKYLCSERTMYRILAEHHQVRERRDQLRHPRYAAPELLANRPNEVWSWDITKLLGPSKWTYFYLYVILDIFSRYVVGWMVAYRESAELAQRLIQETLRRQGIEPGELTLHADRGSSMTSKPVAFLLAELGVTKTHSRPHVSNDNPYSESQFKTMKYRPEFPGRFGSYPDARGFCESFFRWYHHEHHHSGLGFLTPFEVHFGQAKQRREKRAMVLRDAYEKNPERFVRGLPEPPALPEQVWINKPKETALRNHSEALEVPNSLVDGLGRKNGFHICPITHDQESGRDLLPMGQNQASEDIVQ
jgi:putative transposase